MQDGFWRLVRRWAGHNAYDVFSALLLISLLVAAMLTWRDYGISNDEEVQHRYGEMIIAYYASGFADRSLFNFQNLYLYGGLFDIAAVLISYIIPADPYVIRHLLCPLLGIAGIGFTWATARLIAGPRGAAIAAVSLCLCGVWYGGMFNHTKDIPFGAAMIGATYFLIRAMRALPRPHWRDVMFFGVLLGAALGQRATGLLMVVYLTAAVGFATFRVTSDARERARFVIRSALSFVPAVMIAYAIMIAAWPWASLNVFNPVRAIFAFAHFHYPIRTLLAGQIYDMATVPRWYVPVYLLIKLPLVIWFGAAAAILIAVVTTLRGSAGRARDEIALIIISVALPLFCQVAGHGPAFTGMRHFLFVVPAFAVLAGIGLDALLRIFEARRPIYGLALSGVVAAVMIWNATLLIRLHPEQYLFYSPLVGGLEGASRQYDTDYWVNIMPEAVTSLETFLRKTERGPASRLGRFYTVAVCGERLPFEKEADAPLKWADDWQLADFYISPTHMDCDTALEGKVIATIDRLGVPIGVIKDRRALTRPEFATAFPAF